MSNFIATSFMCRELFKNVTKILGSAVRYHSRVATPITKSETDFLCSTNVLILTSVTVASNANSLMPKYIHCNMHHET